MNNKNRNSSTRNVMSYKRAVPRQWMKDLGTVLLFCILFPYVVATFGGTVHKSTLTNYADALFVRMETETGMELVPLNNYIVGSLAASIDLGMEEETLKAQAVVLRTAVMEAYGRRKNKEENWIDGKGLGQEYFSVWQLRQMWEENFQANFQKISDIVKKTDGIVMTYEGIVIKAPYFYVSAGRTRKGNESYPYLQAVESLRDFNCAEFVSQSIYPVEFFQKEMAALFEDDTISGQEADVSTYLLSEDESGYVKTVSFGSKKVTGEKLKEAFSLASTHFRLEKTGEGICITVKGKGHGIGFDQYGANELAKEGKEYDEILKYYFTDIEIEKN